MYPFFLNFTKKSGETPQSFQPLLYITKEKLFPQVEAKHPQETSLSPGYVEIEINAFMNLSHNHCISGI